MTHKARLSRLESKVKPAQADNPYMLASLPDLDAVILAMYQDAPNGSHSQKCFAAAVDRMTALEAGRNVA
jgi:hypothetical protein